MRRFMMVLVAIGAMAAQVQAAEIKIGTLAPDGSTWMESVRAGASEVEQRTAGRVKFRFYPGGTMGNEQAMLRKMRIGQLHGTAVLSGTLSTISSDLEVYSRPLLFESYDEVDAVRRVIDPRLSASLEAGGYVSFGLIEGGFAYILSTSNVQSFGDLKGRKAWLPEGDVISETLLREAGMVPVSLPLSDVLTGLQTGLVDVVAGPPVGMIALQWFTKARYMVDLPVLYTYGGLILSQRAFSGVSAEDQAVVREVFGRVVEKLDREARESNRGAREALVKQGVVIVESSPTVEAEWHRVASRANEELRQRLELDPDLVRRIDGLLQELRAGSRTAQQASAE